MTREKAIKIIKEFINGTCLHLVDQEALETLIPELTESEDERIIKTLQDYVKNRNWPLNGPTQDEVLAWLEKRKEQKPTEYIPDSVKFSEGYKTGREVGFREGVESVKPTECLKAERDGWYVCIKDYYRGGRKRSSVGDLVQAKGGMHIMGEEDISEWFRRAYYEEVGDAFKPNADTNIPEKSAEFTHHETNESLKDAVTHQMEDDGDIDDFVRKGIDDVVLKYAELGAKWQKEPKPVEWEWPNLSNCIKNCKKCQGKCFYRKEPYEEQKPAEPSGKLSREEYLYQLLIDQLITYSDYEYLTGKNPAWSEEDEKMLENIRYALRYAFGKQTAEYVMTWLKDLRPSWKPSEEQPSLPDNLDEVAREIVIKMHPCLKDCTILGDRLTRGQLMALVKAGAEWGVEHLKK